FRDNAGAGLLPGDVPVYRAGFLNGSEILGRDPRDGLTRRSERLVDSGNRDLPHQFRVAVHKGFDIGQRGGLSDRGRDIDCEEVGWVEETVHSAEVYVVGVYVVRMLPGQLTNSFVGSRPDARRFAPNDEMFAIRFIPHRDDF